MGDVPDNKVHGADMGPIWGRQDPGGPHVGPMNNVIWGLLLQVAIKFKVQTDRLSSDNDLENTLSS